MSGWLLSGRYGCHDLATYQFRCNTPNWSIQRVQASRSARRGAVGGGGGGAPKKKRVVAAGKKVGVGWGWVV